MKITKEEVINLEHRLVDAIKGSEVAFLDEILHNDLLFITPNGQTITKQMDLASHRSKEMVVEKNNSVAGKYKYHRRYSSGNDCV